jgi:Protein of unknown function (DUF3631)
MSRRGFSGCTHVNTSCGVCFCRTFQNSPVDRAFGNRAITFLTRGYKLGRSLGPFGIRSRNHRGSSASVAKGYCQEDFADAWERYKQEQIPVANSEEALANQELAKPKTRNKRNSRAGSEQP